MERCTELTVPVSVREGWQRLGKKDQRETALHQTPQASAASKSLLFIYSLSAELQIDMRGQHLRSTSQGEKGVNHWKTTKQNELSSSLPRQI